MVVNGATVNLGLWDTAGTKKYWVSYLVAMALGSETFDFVVNRAGGL